MPAGLAVDPARGIKTVPANPDVMNRDHMNNQAALLSRGDNPSRGLAMAIPQWVHMNGYTFGDAAKPHTTKSHGPNAGMPRTMWISLNPSLGLFKEFMHELRVYHEAGHLDCEVVGSYRYMYRKHVALHGATHTNPQIAKLLMMYLHFAAHGVTAAML